MTSAAARAALTLAERRLRSAMEDMRERKIPPQNGANERIDRASAACTKARIALRLAERKEQERGERR